MGVSTVHCVKIRTRHREMPKLAINAGSGSGSGWLDGGKLEQAGKAHRKAWLSTAEVARMTVYDLDKKATQGPYSVEGTSVMAPTGWKQDDPWFLGASVTMHICSTDQNHRPTPEQLANAKLIVHTRNNYLKALATLIKASVIIGDEYGEKSEQFIEIARAIKELETVQ